MQTRRLQQLGVGASYWCLAWRSWQQRKSSQFAPCSCPKTQCALAPFPSPAAVTLFNHACHGGHAMLWHCCRLYVVMQLFMIMLF